MKTALHITKKKWESNIKHHNQANDFRAGFKQRNGECLVIRQACKVTLLVSTGFVWQSLQVDWVFLKCKINFRVDLGA
jgi:hypothetical protein